MNKTFLLTGGNLGGREENLARARNAIEDICGRISRASGLYETAAWGNTAQPAFLNQALELETVLAAPVLMSRLLSIEEEIGRVRKEKYGPRIIDIDILLFNNDVIDTPSLIIPHPQMHLRRFVLTPLTEIAGNSYHPVLHKTITELLDSCPDMLEVKKYS